MGIIFCINGDSNSKKETKYVINFFGILGCIKVNIPGKTPTKQEGDFNLVEYYFDYPYFSQIVNSKYFKKELEDGEKRFTRRIVSLWLCAAILSTASNVLLYLAYSNQKSKKVIAGLATASVILFTIACVFFVAGFLWMFFDFVKEKLIVHKIKSLLKDLDPEQIKYFKDKVTGLKSKVDVEICNQESEKNKDIEEILQFLLDRKKIPALFNFLTNGEKLVQAGMAMVNKLLLAGVDPNDIVLDTNSMGAGIGAEVVRRFEEQGIYLTLIHSNSYSSLKDVANTFKGRLAALCLNILHKLFGLELNSEEVIKKTKCPVLIASREGDPVITKEAQLAGKLNNLIIPGKTFRLNVTLEHYSGKNCNIHTAHEEDLVWNNGEESERYPKVKSDFIELAHDYLTSYGLNEGFNPQEYSEGKFSKDLNKITLVPLSELDNSLTVG